MANTFAKIASVTVGAGGTSSIAFSSIPNTYTDLVIKASTRSNRSDAINDYIKIAFNGSYSSWTANFMQGTGTAVNAYTASVAPDIIGETNSAQSTASTFGNFEIYVPNYLASAFKSIVSDSVMENKSTTAICNLLGGVWSSNNPITSISLNPGVGTAFIEHSTATLYGIKKN